MGVKLRNARGQGRQQPMQVMCIDSGILQQSKDSCGMLDFSLPQGWTGPRRKRRMNKRVECAIKPTSRHHFCVEPKWIPRQPQMSDSPIMGFLHQNVEN